MENNNSQKKPRHTLSIIALLLISGLFAFEFWQAKYQEKKMAKLLSEIEIIKADYEELRLEYSNLSTISNELKEKADKNSSDILDINLEKLFQNPNRVNFTEPSIQCISNGFCVAELDMKEHLTGIKLSGRMINTTSVRHKRVTFKAFMGGQEKEFTINQISPGNSTSFSIYIPDVDVKMTNYGGIQYQRSTVEFFIK